MSKKVAVVTGANKGIGLAIVEGLCERFDGVVYLTARDEALGRAAVAELNALGLKPEFHQLDVADRDSVKTFRYHIQDNHDGIDILVNNAGIINNEDFYNDYEESKAIIDVNYKSILTIQELLYPLMKSKGRIINMSSDCGHLSNIRNEYWIKRLSNKQLTYKDINEFVDWHLENVKNGTFKKEDFADDGKLAAYRVSKVALSAATLLQHQALKGRGVAVNALHPGLVQTSLTRGAGFYTPREAAHTALYLALDVAPALSGAYIWFDRRILDWYNHKADYYFHTDTLKPIQVDFKF